MEFLDYLLSQKRPNLAPATGNPIVDAMGGQIQGGGERSIDTMNLGWPGVTFPKASEVPIEQPAALGAAALPASDQPNSAPAQPNIDLSGYRKFGGNQPENDTLKMRKALLSQYGDIFKRFDPSAEKPLNKLDSEQFADPSAIMNQGEFGINKVNQNLKKTMEETKFKTEAYQAEVSKINEGYNKNFDDFYQTQKELLDNPPEMSPVDQGRMWRNAGTGSKIMMGIGLAFAALTPETIKGATGVIQDAIKNDINAQIHDQNNAMARYKMKVENNQSLMSFVGDKVKNDLAAKNLAYATGYKFAIDKVNMQMQGVSNQAQLANLANVKNQLTMEMQKFKQQADMAFREQQTKDAAIQLKSLEDSGALLKQMPMGTANMSELMKNIYSNVPEEYRKEAVKEAGKIDQQLKNEKYINDIYNEYDEKYIHGPVGTMAGHIPFTKAKTDYDLAFGKILNLAQQAEGLKRLNETELKHTIKPLAPAAGDTKEQLMIKKNEFLTLLKNNVGDTPTLNQFGLNPFMNRSVVTPRK